jgi:hypothetical protein
VAECSQAAGEDAFVSVRNRIMAVALAALTLTAALFLGEALVWLASPTEYLYPRYQFSPEYGLIPFANVTMVHGIPRKYQFRYTVGAGQGRGATPTPDAVLGMPVVETLGDSYAFGMGVSDGEEFPAVMQRALGDRAAVVNLGEPGWGLTQEVRRFVEVGESYRPRVVVLQFCANDPDDNLANRVTVVEDGQLAFRTSANSLNWIKKYLSRSIVQRTQLYNFFRTRASRVLLERLVRHEESRLAPPRRATPSAAGPSAKERVYIDLLDALARRVDAGGATLIMISVDGQLAQFPGIEQAVRDLQSEGLLRYVEVLDWLRGMPPYGSPEGHVWNERAHDAVGKGLADVVGSILAGGDSGTPAATQ